MFDWIKKAKVTAHYRKLPNGKIIHIDEYRDSRKDAEQNPAAYKNKFVSADEHHTSVIHNGQLKTYKHTPQDEMKNEDIYNYLGQTTPIDEAHMWKHWKYRPETRDEFEGTNPVDSHDVNKVLQSYLHDHKEDAKANGEEPALETVKDMRDWITENEIKPKLKKLKKKGATEFATKSDHAELYKAIYNSPEADYHEKAEARMATEHGEAAKEHWEKQEMINLQAMHLRPQDCPDIPSTSSKIELFPHQAEVLAKLNKMTKAIVDVDMGGGKGLLLPFDAINLMAQGKVKRPLIVATNMTLHQNAKKILEYTDNKMNVFVIDGDLVNNHYKGDMEKLVEDIKNAPPNTIFTTSYDFISHNHGAENEPDPTKHYLRAQALAGGDFDLVSLDECFHPDTLIDMADGTTKRIAEIKIGDMVKSASGEMPVISTSNKQLDKHIRLRFNGQEIKCSLNHPWLTPSGWVMAKDIIEGDWLVNTSEAMRMVHEGISTKISSERNEQESFLRHILFSEMADDSTINTRENVQRGSKQENIGSTFRNGKALGCKTDEREKSDEQFKNTDENDSDIEENRSQTSNSHGQWNGNDETRGIVNGSIGKWLGVEFSNIYWQEEAGDSSGIQAGLSISSEETVRGVRRLLTPITRKESARFKEKGSIECFRVDNVEVYESGSDERNPEGRYYDIGVAGHPSYSINGVLVHNCQKVKNPDSGRHIALQYFSGAAYKRLATGTFISKDPADVVGQMSWLYPGRTQNLDDFAKQYGFTKSKAGYTWSDKGVKQLREDLLAKGFISIRRTNWMHLLPERDEKTSVVHMEPKQALANESAITDAMDAIQQLADTDPKVAAELRKLQGDPDEQEDEENPTGKVIDAINTLTGIVDHPNEYSKKVKAFKDVCDKAGVDYSYNPDAWKKGYDGEEGEEEGPELAKPVKQAQKFLQKFRPQTLKAILNLDGEVSAKAKDAYAKMKEHFADPKNGKFIVFTKRINSARHVFDNLPPELKKMAVYYDGSHKEGLEPFLDTKDKNGPQIIVACDESIKEGVNMQMANGMYRYDLGWTPGETEQSYGRIWRFGQDKPVKIHVGISDRTLDVTKYARLASRHNSNMKVTSDYDEVPGFTAFKMSVDNMRNNRSADLLPEYEQVGKAVLDYQKRENKKVHAMYGDSNYKKHSPSLLPGSQKASGKMYATMGEEPKADAVVSKRDDTAETIKKPSSKAPEKKAEEKPEVKTKITPENGDQAPSSSSTEPLTADENNAAAEHHLRHAAHHASSENKGLAKKHWNAAVRHLKAAGKGKRDAHLTHLAKDEEAFAAYAKSVKKKHPDLPDQYVEHKHDKRLPPKEEKSHSPNLDSAKKPEKTHAIHDKLVQNRGVQKPAIEKTSDLTTALSKVLSEAGYADLDASVIKETEDDLKAFVSHTDKGGNAQAYWKKWAKQYGGAPDDEHKAVVERAAQVLNSRGKK
jgi:hypothetical protein